jgi:hypothetical protein
MISEYSKEANSYYYEYLETVLKGFQNDDEEKNFLQRDFRLFTVSLQNMCSERFSLILQSVSFVCC